MNPIEIERSYELNAQSQRILVIDDNPSIHEDFRKILCPTAAADDLAEDEVAIFGRAEFVPKLAHFEIDSAYQGEEGLALVKKALVDKRPYSMAFVDVRMPPGWDGIESIQHIWKSCPDLQIVICTAYSDHSCEEIIQMLGRSDSLLILKKPFDNAEVLQLAHAMSKKWVLTWQARFRIQNLASVVERHTRALVGTNQQLQEEVNRRTAVEQELREAGETLRSKEAHLRLAGQVMGLGTYEYDLASNKRFLSPAMRTMYGVEDAGQTPFASLSERLVMEDRAGFLAALASSSHRESGGHFDHEHRVQQPDGSLRWLHSQAQTWFEGEGAERRAVMMVGAVTDISARKQAETALRVSEAEFRALAEAMPQMVWITRPDGWTIYFSQQWMDYSGLTLEESLGHGWNKPFHPEDQQRTWDAWQHATSTIGTYSVECRLRRADGAYRWWLIRGVPQRDQGGDVLKWFGTCTDIHDLKLAEESARLLGSAVEQAQESIVITDANLDLPGPKIIFTNPSFTQMTGYTTEEVLGKTLRILQGPQTDPNVLERLRHSLARGEPFEGEAINYRKDGTVFDLAWQIAPLRDEDGVITHFVAIQRDITERKRVEAELKRTHSELLEASRQAGMAEVASGILHNVGNVLNSVNVASTCMANSLRRSKAANLSRVVTLLNEHEAGLGAFLSENPRGKHIPGYLAQLAKDLAEEQASALEELAQLQKNIEHIKEIVTTQQTLARESPVTENLNINDLFEDALQMNLTGLTQDDVQVSKEFEVMPMISVQKHKVLQIFVNLVRNAQQSCAASGMKPKIISVRSTRRDGAVRICVRDSGVGIPPENLTRIFSHGFTTKEDGHGFGLHSAALAAKQMGGSLSVQSDGTGHGAAFTLELPALP